MTGHLNAPHGGELIDLIASDDRSEELRKKSRDWKSWDLTDRQICDLELLMNGGFSPLRGFMARADYGSVVDHLRLVDGTTWPIPVTLDVGDDFAAQLTDGETIALRDAEGVMLAALHIEDIWRPDKGAEAQSIYGTVDPEHPGVGYLMNRSGATYIGGAVEGVQLPVHYDYTRLRMTPTQVRAEFALRGWTRVVAFQTQDPMHRAQVEMTRRAAADQGADLLIHSVVGLIEPGNLDHYTRVRCLQAVLNHYPHNMAMLSLLPMATRKGPRQSVLQAIVAKNHGATHLIVGSDHTGSDSADRLLFPRDELGVKLVAPEPMVYAQDLDSYLPADEVTEANRTLSMSAGELRDRLAEGREVPGWFTYPEVVTELRRSHPPRSRQGLTVFLTGLSGSGKSTIANALLAKLLEGDGRRVTLLDGDIVRKNLSSELGFSKKHRDLNIHRIGFVASEITKNGGIAICAPIAPYDVTRKAVRKIIEDVGGFMLVHVSTPIEVCEERDRKGLYAKARAGIVPEFTGISDPYEEPEDAELVIDTTHLAPEEAANQIILQLERLGYIGSS